MTDVVPESTARLNQLALHQFRALFTSLPVPEPGSLAGTYRAEFVGPGWLRASAAPALVLTGLGGWWGKEFHADDTAVNLVQRGGQLQPIFPMKLVRAASFIDMHPGLALHYLPGSPFPWRFVIDELRRLSPNTLLGMTLANINGLRRLAFPFTLQKAELP